MRPTSERARDSCCDSDDHRVEESRDKLGRQNGKNTVDNDDQDLGKCVKDESGSQSKDVSGGAELTGIPNESRTIGSRKQTSSNWD